MIDQVFRLPDGLGARAGAGDAGQLADVGEDQRGIAGADGLFIVFFGDDAVAHAEKQQVIERAGVEESLMDRFIAGIRADKRRGDVISGRRVFKISGIQLFGGLLR